MVLMNYNYADNPKYLDELINRLKSAYPSENIIHG